MNKMQLLVVDDEWNMRNLLRIYLTKHGFDILEAKNGHEALAFVDQHPFDLIILDIMMPDMDGWEVCTKIRKTRQTPILMLTARTGTREKVHGLNIGADDYLVKPFEPEELIARVFALLRRSKMTASSNLVSKYIMFPEMIIDPDGRKILVQEKPVDFTPKEFELLHMLASHTGRVFSRERLLELIWGDDYFGDIRTVDTHVKNIREKVRIAGLSYVPIQTVWGVGYKFGGFDERT